MITLRTARPTDLATLDYWDTKPHVIAASGADDVFNWDVELNRYPDWREQLIGEVDGRAVGMIQIIDPAREETKYWGEIDNGFRAIDIWLGEERDLGRGYGSWMMRLALERCFEDPAVLGVLVDPLRGNTLVHRFYERLGFRKIERRMFGQDDCLVYLLTRSTYESPKPSRRSMI